MDIAIIEDEPLAALRLQQLIGRLQPQARVLALLDSVQAAVAWLRANPAPDLLFCDIQLGDGLSFEIFEQVEVRSPLVFTTAYDSYAIQAFKLNSLDYLLKPLKEEELGHALQKYEQLRMPDPALLRQLRDMLQPQELPAYRQRFLVRVGEQLHVLPCEQVAYFMSEQKATFLVTLQGQHFALEQSLSQLEAELDPKAFFRISRTHLLHMPAIRDIGVYSSSRLCITPVCSTRDELLVSREKVGAFKAWLEG